MTTNSCDIIIFHQALIYVLSISPPPSPLFLTLERMPMAVRTPKPTPIDRSICKDIFDEMLAVVAVGTR